MQANQMVNQYRMITVCIDSYENQVPGGHFYTPNGQEEVYYYGVMDFIKKMDSMLDQFDIAQNFSSIRSFAKTPVIDGYRTACDGMIRGGKLATLGIRILFRQNASWQGSVMWREGKKEESFRSVLELLFLFDSAIAGERDS